MPTPAIKHADTRQPLPDPTERTCGCDFPASPECECDTSCPECWPDFQEPREVTAWMRWEPIRNALVCLTVIGAILAAVLLIWPSLAQGRPTKNPEPIAAPQSLLKAREACPNTATLVECRGELRKAYAAVSWQRAENLKLARQMVGKLGDWTCIHNGEGAWNARTGNGYYGGLQMDATFERTYGRDMLQRYHAHADAWPPRQQIIVAQRAFVQGRGYAPWPQTSRACGLR